MGQSGNKATHLCAEHVNIILQTCRACYSSAHTQSSSSKPSSHLCRYMGSLTSARESMAMPMRGGIAQRSSIS